MFKLNITKKLFWFVAMIVLAGHIAVSLYLYNQTKEMVEHRAWSRALSLESYFLSMRYVYHQQFLSSGLEITDNTVGFLPAHASTFISDMFEKRSKDGVTMRNVSDKARNPKNKADEFELQAIEYFKNNPDKEPKMEVIVEDGIEKFFYSSPIKTEAYCISCHGKKEEVLPFVAKKYDTAFGYGEGEIRGITSIKVPKKTIGENTMKLFWSNSFFSLLTTIVLLIVLYYIIRRLTIKDAEAKAMLQLEVNNKTAQLRRTADELQVANEKQKHLFSILRTVADCNQILITTSSIEELVSKTAYSMYSNDAFDSVKIIVLQDGILKVLISLGLDENSSVLPLEQQVFDTNQALKIDMNNEQIPKVCVERIKKFNLKEVYVIPFVKDTFSTNVLGVLSVSTSEKSGLSIEEQNMIQELAGDIGFAINSFLQKDIIHKLAYYDVLTNLPNKRFLLKQMPTTLLNSIKNKEFVALIYINYDNFKNINDIKGVMIGDRLLQETATRLIEYVNYNESIFKLGGDEFLVLCEHLDSDSTKALKQTQTIAQNILDILNKPFVIDNQDIYMTLSIGIVLFNESNIDIDTLINNAETAMQNAKKSAKNTISFYDPKLEEIAFQRTLMMQGMKESMIANEFYMLYQKQLDRNQEIVGVEALIRWKHKEFGVVSPSVFVKLAEESGIILELGKWIFEQSISQLYKWEDDDSKKLWRISINVSPLQFKNDSFVDDLLIMVDKYGVEYQKIRLELTEGILIDDAQKATIKIKQLKEKGFSISIDDFGTGYSSLAYLKHLPIDELKIDQSFVANLGQSKEDQTIVKTIISMGEVFGLEVLAEGVETQEQFDILKNLGCQYFQGFLFAKPQEPKEL